MSRSRGAGSSPLLAPWMLRTRRRGEFSPHRTVDVENKEEGRRVLPSSRRGCREQGGGEKNSPLLVPWMSRLREEEGRTPSLGHGCREQGEEGRVLPSSRRGCQDRERRGESRGCQEQGEEG